MEYTYQDYNHPHEFLLLVLVYAYMPFLYILMGLCTNHMLFCVCLIWNSPVAASHHPTADMNSRMQHIGLFQSRDLKSRTVIAWLGATSRTSCVMTASHAKEECWRTFAKSGGLWPYSTAVFSFSLPSSTALVAVRPRTIASVLTITTSTEEALD